MAGYVGGGGVGDLALTYGYEKMTTPLMILTVVILVVLVQLLQILGNTISGMLRQHKLKKRRERIMRKVIAGVLMGAAVLSLAACGKTETAATTAAQAAESQDTQADSTEAAADTTGDKKEIVYGKSQGPYTELFEAAIVPILEKEGYTVKGVDFSDLQTADIGLNDGDVDVNVEQHTAYMENFSANYNADLVALSPVATVPAGV